MLKKGLKKGFSLKKVLKKELLLKKAAQKSYFKKIYSKKDFKKLFTQKSWAIFYHTFSYLKLLKKVNCIDPNLQIQVVTLSLGWLVNPAETGGHWLRRPGR